MTKPYEIHYLPSKADMFIRMGGLSDGGGSLQGALRELIEYLYVRFVTPF